MAFLYSSGTYPPLSLIEPSGINTQGQICGYGTIKGYSHAFLLTPK